jgi:integrase
MPGFGVRVYPSGRRAFVISYRAGGGKKLMVIESCDRMTLAAARKQAKKEFARLADGKDPLKEKEAARRGRTLGDLLDYFLENHVDAQGLKTAANIRRRLERNIPASWKSKDVNSIEGWQIEDLHKKLRKKGLYEANRTLEHFKTMFRHAPRWNFRDPAKGDPTEGIKKFKERKRKRWARPEEVKAIAKAIDRESNIYIRAAIWLYLLTAVRKSELLEARRDKVDWTRAELTLDDTKSGEEQFVPLNAPALAIMQALPAISKNPYLLPSTKKQGGHLVNIDKPWGRIRKAAGVEDIRLHDLRRTVGSWMSQSGVDLNHIKSALRHSNISTTLIYTELGADPAREAMEEHGKRVLAAAGRQGPVGVVAQFTQGARGDRE